MPIIKKIKRSYERFLKNLASENKKTFGDGKLDCCDLHKKDQQK